MNKKRERLIIIGIGLTLLLLSVFMINKQVNRVKNEFQSSLMRNSITTTKLKMEMLFKPVIKNLISLEKWGGNGLLTVKKEKQMLDLISPLLLSNRKINNITIYASSGSISRIRKKSTQFYPIQNLIPQKSKQYREVIFENYTIKNSVNGAILNIVNEIIDRKNIIDWYFNDDQNEKQIIATVNWNIDTTTYVALIEIDMDTIISSITATLPTINSQFFIQDSKGKTVLLSAKSLTEYSDIEKNTPQNIKILLEKRDNSLNQIIKIEDDNLVYKAIMDTVSDKSHFLIGVITPKQELDKIIGNKRIIWYAILFFIFIIIIIMTTIISKYQIKYSEKGDGFYKIKLDEVGLKKIILEGESDTLEFKSTVRYNLHTKKNGREIEMAWLKNVVAFLNTNGGIILLGVTDDGEIFGLKNDAFVNADKCLLHIHELIKRHIGPDFVSNIVVSIILIEGKDVVSISISKAQTPAYLKDGNSEDFYIRSGPSAAKLTVSKAISYIAKRF